MLVFGDSKHCSTWDHEIALLGAAFARLPLSPSLDELRQVLVSCGQLEQGVADSGASNLSAIEVLTDSVASCFVWRFLGHAAKRPVFDEGLRGLQNHSLWIKEPEGFSFYALYPEQYIQSAFLWADAHIAEPSGVAVVGIRSIGTTLSAVVKAALEARGYRVRRLTVRPNNVSFGPKVDLPRIDEPSALVVDEGPGLSGSTMASVVQALREKGKRDVAILPGHAKGPGSHASNMTRQLWGSTPQYVTDLAQLRWQGQGLEERLMLASPSPACECIDLSVGQWRRLLFNTPGQWPAVCKQFEKLKYLVRFKGGRAWLWKFTGHLPRRPKGALAHCSGFSAFEWIEGPRSVSHGQARQLLLQQVIQSARPLEQPHNALQRLRRIVRVNITEAFGPALAIKALKFCPRRSPPYPRAFDGRVAPHEWIWGLQHAPLNPNVATEDHAAPGPQPLLWDLAALAVEWQWPARGHLPGLPPVPRDVLLFYLAAYLAFRIGLSEFAAAQDPEEAGRFRTLAKRYRLLLQRLLTGSSALTASQAINL